MLRQFWRWLKITRRDIQPAEARFVGYNIDRFDAPFILQRSLKLGLARAASQLRPTTDLMLILANGGPFVKLDKACERFGIAHANGLRGSDMPAAFKRGDFESIREHCVDDIRVEWKLYEAMRSTGLLGRRAA